MIRLTIASTDNRNTDIIDEALTPKQALANANINYTRATVILDGCTMTPEKMNKSFRDLGVQGDATLAVCVKLDNAGCGKKKKKCK